MRAVTETNLGAALQTDGKLDDAVVHYRRATELQPDYAPAFNNLGTALRAKGDLPDAVAAYQRALETKPDAWQSRYYNDDGSIRNAQLRFWLSAIPSS